MKFFLEAAKDDLQGWEAPGNSRGRKKELQLQDEQLLSSELYNQRHMVGAIYFAFLHILSFLQITS